ncbi:hypothetical protein [Nonomuraea longicatena]
MFAVPAARGLQARGDEPYGRPPTRVSRPVLPLLSQETSTCRWVVPWTSRSILVKVVAPVLTSRSRTRWRATSATSVRGGFTGQSGCPARPAGADVTVVWTRALADLIGGGDLERLRVTG